jgi:hypothetical protein
MRIAAAALLYFAIVFGAGFLLGPIRVFWIEPRVGPTIAVLCEAPFLLAVMIVAARWIPSTLRVKRDLPSLALMGFGALGLQQVADIALGIVLRHISFAEQLAHFATASGIIYGILLMVFALMPMLSNRATPG